MSCLVAFFKDGAISVPDYSARGSCNTGHERDFPAWVLANIATPFTYNAIAITIRVILLKLKMGAGNLWHYTTDAARS